MTKNDEAELAKAINDVEHSDDDEYSTQRAEEIDWVIERLCDMDDKDYRKFIRSMHYERKARKHLGNLSNNA